MEELEMFFAQNWIEQFRDNIFARPYSLSIDSVTRAFAMYETATEVIQSSFEWARTPQHPERATYGVWARRREKFVRRDGIIG